MPKILLIVLCLIIAGCTDRTKSQSPTESEKLMLQCKDNLRMYGYIIGRGPNRGKLYFEDSSKKSENSVMTLPRGIPGCPATDEDTYSESYNPKTGELYCKGHHHSKAGLEADYPRLVAPPEPTGEMTEDDRRLQLFTRDFAPDVKENELGVTPLPTGFPLPLYATVEVLSSTVGRRDGVFRVHFRYHGDLEELEKKWRKALDYQVLNPYQKASFWVEGSTRLGNQIGATIDLKTGVVEVQWEPAFLINDLVD